MHAPVGLGSSKGMSAAHLYCHSGLVVASEIDLPEWETFACLAREADVRIVLSDEPCPDCPTDGSTAVAGETMRFAVDGVGGWQIEGGHTICLHPSMAANPPELRLFTLGSAWGALGYQRGFAMWHGSAVARSGRALMFCGDAGEGKSTMAGAMLARGATLVADDLSRIDPAGESVVIYPSSARIKLWRGAIEHLGWQARVIQRDYFREDKFHCSVGADTADSGPVPLAGVVVLADGEEVSLTRLAGAAALEAALTGTIYRPEMLEKMGCWGEQGALAAQVVAQVPVWRLVRPKDFGALDAACEATDALWN